MKLWWEKKNPKDLIMCLPFLADSLSFEIISFLFCSFFLFLTAVIYSLYAKKGELQRGERPGMHV